MQTYRHVLKLSLFFLLCATPWLRGQELSVLGGVMRTGAAGSSYTWQVDYRQNFHENFAGSVAYINEGHVPGHHRDGNAFQAWGRLPFWENRVAVALGAGAYYFYDTQYTPAGGSANVHGTAAIYSASATGYLSNRWFCRVLINRIVPSHEIQTTTAAVGVGFWFGQDGKPTPGKLGDAPSEQGFVSNNEITGFAGQSVVNTFLSEQARAYALDYRRGLTPHLDWTATAIYEGDPQIIRRNGLATQLWAVNSFFDDKVNVGIGAGPYIYIDQKHPATNSTTVGSQKIPAAIAPLVSLTVARQLSEHWAVRLTWHRVISTYNRDSDIFLLGLGYRWR
jgi:hypothetical protein